MSRADIRKLERQYRRAGWVIQPTRSSHRLWIAPDGTRLVTSGTPSDPRSILNHMARVKRVERAART